MRKAIAALLLGTVSLTAVAAAEPGKDWIAKSNTYTQKLLDIDIRHSPEQGSGEGLSKFDTLISDPRLSDDLAQRKELTAALTGIKAKAAKETDPNIQQDVAILQKAFELRFRQQDFALAHEVQFRNASEEIFQGLRVLLDDQVAAERRPAAVERLKKYVGAEKGFTPFAELLKQRTLAQIAKPGVFYPSKGEVETELGRNANYVSGIADLFKKYGIKGGPEDGQTDAKRGPRYDDDDESSDAKGGFDPTHGDEVATDEDDPRFMLRRRRWVECLQHRFSSDH